MAKRGHNWSQEVAEVPKQLDAKVCIEWIETMGEHSFPLKLHLEHEDYLWQMIAQLQQRIYEETDGKAKECLEQYKKELQQELQYEEQELRKLRAYDPPGGNYT
jgi:hypothetical protein